MNEREPMSEEPAWLQRARELAAMAQAGATFAKDPYDLERYQRLREIAADMLAEGFRAPVETLRTLLASEAGYPTPKVDVRGAVIRDGRILLVREVSDGLWTVPGGWADVNESASACAVREVREESGFEARVVKLVGVWDSRRQGYRYRHPFCIYKLFFLCELLGGTPKPSIETSEVGFFALETLPALSRGRVNATQIARMFAHQHDPALPAEFD